MSDQTAHHGVEVDKISGVETTGHEWDGLKELNNPLPRWWLILLYICIVVSVIYMVLMPAIPFLGGDHTRGITKNSQRQEAIEAYQNTIATRQAAASGLTDASVTDIASDQSLLEFAMAAGAAAFGDNCAPCHGNGAIGGPGYPNLQDDDWLWGGDLDTIYETIRVGINSGHDETRYAEMLAFGDDGMLDAEQIKAVATYVRSISGQEVADTGLVDEGQTVFEEQCTSCHGEDGKGMHELGAPNLTDTVWLYGGDLDTIIQTVTHGRGGEMPTWEGRLDDETIKSLAVYVHSLGGGA